ncbi:MAG: FAD-dependent oxidoreductase, partial [Oscillospiraceae bacterium]
MFDVIVIGGGAAGMMAAAAAAEYGAYVAVIEKNDRLGKKLAITGKGRCNLTNNSDLAEVMNNIPANARFLYSALSAFSTADVMDYFESLGV